MYFSLVNCSQKCKDSKYSKKSKEGKSNSSSQKGSNTQTICWLYPQIKVRIISKNYKKGKYYNKKVYCLSLTIEFFNVQTSSKVAFLKTNQE